MAKLPTIYDLVLVLSTGTEEDERTKLISDVEASITTGGGIVERSQSWGARPMTFEINHQGEGAYHLLQFSGPTEILEALSHTLRIDDRVLRFRIIKVLPGTPPPPEGPPPLVGVVGAPSAPAGPRDEE